MRRHFFSLGCELKLSYMSSILLSYLLFFFPFWQETNMAHALRHLDKVTIELFTHGLFHFKRKSMSILQNLMTETVHRNSHTQRWGKIYLIRTFHSLHSCNCRSSFAQYLHRICSVFIFFPSFRFLCSHFIS